MYGRAHLVLLSTIAAVGLVMLITAAHAPPAQSTEVKLATAAGPATAIATTVSLTPVVARVTAPHADPELRLISVLEDLRRGQIDSALAGAEELVENQPLFRLAHLVHGDILASRAGGPVAFEARADEVEMLLAEARQRWRHYRSHTDGEFLPDPLLQLSESQPHAVVVDLAQSRLFVFENRQGKPTLISDYYVSGGKNGAHKQVQGDRKTPVGVYFVVDRLPGDQLPDKYGPVAFPVDYPNQWDKRLGRTGGGIWLHGVASTTYSRPPLDSDGCVALANKELEQIAPLLKEGSTPVIIGENLNWVAAGQVEKKRSTMQAAIEQWRSDWESGELDQYLDHYSDEFVGRGMDKKAWVDYKTRVTRSKRYIKVALDDVSVFEHPHEQDMIVVSFRQQYDSDSFSSEARKRQYWRAEADGRWRIISEETV